ncbi:MAG: hypothetical protein ACLSG9_10110 [Eubacterium sp.]
MLFEAGIDEPDATVILMEKCRAFWIGNSCLSIRGRVGREVPRSYRILMTGKALKESRQRLDILAGSNDGFYICRGAFKTADHGPFELGRAAMLVLNRRIFLRTARCRLRTCAKEAALSDAGRDHTLAPEE